MQLCGSLSILWHCLSLRLEWKLTFSSPVATAEFSKFAGILSATLSQHHLSGFNSSTGILSPPLALFVVMLSKADLNKISYDYTVKVTNRFKGLDPWISNPKRWCCESVALNMPANLENSAVAIGLEKVSFPSNPKERQCQRMLKLLHNCTHLKC